MRPIGVVAILALGVVLSTLPRIGFSEITSAAIVAVLVVAAYPYLFKEA